MLGHVPCITFAPGLGILLSFPLELVFFPAGFSWLWNFHSRVENPIASASAHMTTSNALSTYWRYANSIINRSLALLIQVHNHHGACVVVVSLVTAEDDKPKPHPHALVGGDCKSEVCTKKVKGSLDCIQYVIIIMQLPL